MDAHLLYELRRETVADVERLDLPVFSHVDNFPVRPDAVDVGDDQADVAGMRRHSGMHVINLFENQISNFKFQMKNEKAHPLDPTLILNLKFEI